VKTGETGEAGEAGEAGETGETGETVEPKGYWSELTRGPPHDGDR